MDAMNGHENVPLIGQEAQMREFSARAQAALNALCQMLSPGYQAGVVFSDPARPANDILITSFDPTMMIAAIQRQMKAAGMVVPANEPAPNEVTTLARLVEATSAMRKAMPFITGPGADTAKAMLTKALTDHHPTIEAAFANYAASRGAAGST